ncbi:head completion/stabilization protein [Cupriavidus nantongensis]|uniref:Head completion/stabilization protein n=1 Tax=Cupriavidus nantongensis TaxID=1796606 RepID=A0A142JGV1_9BURK|nr:head completion/stabilization protein [Cupriavidus nantongensis]AMR77313.1 hypothetical protein A2G96_05955 [Cupriavidus nantongensis]
MSFVSLAPSSTPAADTRVENDGWFPDIDLDKARKAVRLDGSITPERLLHAAINAVIAVNAELAEWKALQLAQERPSLGDVPASKVNGESVQVARYLRAVYSFIKAELAERYRDFDTTGAGERKADNLVETADDYRRDGRWAIRDMLGVGRTTVELI